MLPVKKMCWAKQIAYIHVASLQAPDETGEEIRGRLLKISYARARKKTGRNAARPIPVVF
jgi:hypothetical protein